MRAARPALKIAAAVATTVALLSAGACASGSSSTPVADPSGSSAASSTTIPTSENRTKVADGNVLRTMFDKFLTGSAVALPIVIMFEIIQRKVVSGLTAGAVKG